jgi:hypothetical protein
MTYFPGATHLIVRTGVPIAPTTSPLRAYADRQVLIDPRNSQQLLKGEVARTRGLERTVETHIDPPGVVMAKVDGEWADDAERRWHDDPIHSEQCRFNPSSDWGISSREHR